MPSYELFGKSTQSIVYGLQEAAIQRMLDFDYICQRETPSVAAIINPTRSGVHKVFFGTKEILIPVYTSITTAVTEHPNADVCINFASFRSAYETSLEALNQDSIRTVVIIAEGVPERRARELLVTAQKQEKTIIGPATVGGIKAGCFKVGNTGGTLDNIMACNLHRPGSVAFVSKSGGMSNESYNIIARNTNGVYEGIAIGGDSYPGSTFIDHLLRWEHDPAVAMVVVLGEVGGTDEYAIVDALKAGKITKPLVAWVTGTCAKVFPAEVQFGHAGAMAASQDESADAKNAALKAAGAIVPDSFDDYDEKIRTTFETLKAKGLITQTEEPTPPPIPENYATLVKEGRVRKPTSFLSSIADDRGEELLYNGEKLSSIIEGQKGIGYTLGLLWFKKQLPDWAARFLEMTLIICADHGPAVSGAHNSIIAARAGKDMISALASGLLTIGPRFGGALNDAAHYFKNAVDTNTSPDDFIKSMKDKGINIPGIGHRIKSVQNPDIRVSLVKDYAKKHFAKTTYLDYALEVEKRTTAKRGNLILNVDGTIAVCLLDMMASIPEFSSDEITEIASGGRLNAIFVFGRSIGLIGHIFDQYRLQQPLYRHPWDDILYL